MKLFKSKIIIFIITFVFLISTTLVMVSFAAVTSTTVEDSATGTGVKQFEYIGTWDTSTEDTNLSGGNDHYKNAAGVADGYKFRFYGKNVQLYGNNAAGLGICSVSIDGGAAVTYDPYAATRTTKKLLFDSGVLSEGEHTVTVMCTGTKNAAANNTNMQIDYAIIQSTTEDTAPNIALNKSTLSLTVGGSETLTATVTPASNIGKHILWESSDMSVISVESGVITAKKAGTATVMITLEDSTRPMLSSTCTVTVRS